MNSWKFFTKPTNWSNDEEPYGWGCPDECTTLEIKSIGTGQYWTGHVMLTERIIFYAEYTGADGACIRRRLWWQQMNDEAHQIALYNYLAWVHVKGPQFEARAPSRHALLSVENDGVCFNANPDADVGPDNEEMLESGAPAGPGSFGIERVVRVEFVSGEQECFRFLVRYHRSDGAISDYWLSWSDMSSTIAHSTAVWFYLRNDIKTRAGFVNCVRPQ